MRTLAFILGRLPLLSAAEILRLLGGRNIRYQPLALTPAAFVFEAEERFDGRSFLAELGGSVKFAEIRATLQREGLPGALREQLSVDRLLSEFFPQSEREIPFGASLYGAPERSLLRDVHQLFMEVKRGLASHGYRARVVEDHSGVLSSVSVEKNHLIGLGAELLLVVVGDQVYLGRTAAVQAFEEFAEADYGRPKRDPVAGMLPPKLARIMLNLSGVDRASAKLIDPFCGSGTVVTEALRLGFRHVIASDVSLAAVKATKQNVAWVREREPDRFSDGSLDVLDVSIRNLPNRLAGPVDAIVTEPNLGPALRSKPTLEQAQSIVSDLRAFYTDAFAGFKRLLRPGGVLVTVLPVIRARGKEVTLDLPMHVTKGFRVINPFPANLPTVGLKTQLLSGGIRYYRPGQKVEREIVLFERVDRGVTG